VLNSVLHTMLNRMLKQWVIFPALAFMFCFAEGDVHWSYEGEDGPEHWGEHFEVCGQGLEQSPIDLTAANAMDIPNIIFNYYPSPLNIKHNGHTVQVDYDASSGIILNEQPYRLLQFHFHTPSEHSIDGKLADAEVHFVHGRDLVEGGLELAVVGIMIYEGEENIEFSEVLSNTPSEKTDVLETFELINAAAMLPDAQLVFRYAGSLTTPPCSEKVIWSVMQESITMSAAQLAILQQAMGHNNRPTQALNARDLVLDKQ